MIPKQLKEEGIRFVKLKPHSKIPFEKDWQNRGYNYKEIQEWVDKGNNYGCIGGFGNLRIIDCDKEEFAKIIKLKIPNTFTVKTGGGGLHIYIYSDYDTNHVFLNGSGEFRAKNYQVVGANSIHPNGNKYEISNDVEIVYLSKEKVEEIIKDYIRKPFSEENLDVINNIKDDSRSGREFGEIIKLIKLKLSKKEVYERMMFFSKWATSSDAYRNITYQKAFDIINKENPEDSIIIDTEENSRLLKNGFEMVKTILKSYCSLTPDQYDIVALWILGSYYHDTFQTYPFLYFNAPKASGKTRLLKLIAKLSNNGKLMTNFTEASLFRTKVGTTICLDEFESASSKEKSNIRELLNTAYKKGSYVERAQKRTIKGRETYVLEPFPTYFPIAMANITGLEEVLSDRCIELILEKSVDKRITTLIENFDTNPHISVVKQYLETISSVVSAVKLPQREYIYDYYYLWNSLRQNTSHESVTTLLINCINTTNYTNINNTIYNNNNNNNNNIYNRIDILKKSIKKLSELPDVNDEINEMDRKFFKLISQSNIDGRELELFFPLFQLSFLMDEDFCISIIKIAKEIINYKRSEGLIESKDGMLLDFLNRYIPELGLKVKDFIPVNTIVFKFKDFLNENELKANDWINNKTIGRMLKRNSLIIDKRRMGTGIEVTLNFEKVRLKLKQMGILTETIEFNQPDIEEEVIKDGD